MKHCGNCKSAEKRMQQWRLKHTRGNGIPVDVLNAGRSRLPMSCAISSSSPLYQCITLWVLRSTVAIRWPLSRPLQYHKSTHFANANQIFICCQKSEVESKVLSVILTTLSYHPSPHHPSFPTSKRFFFSHLTLHRHLAPLQTGFTDIRIALRFFLCFSYRYFFFLCVIVYEVPHLTTHGRNSNVALESGNVQWVAGGTMVPTLDLQSKDHEFDSRSGHYQMVTTWMIDYLPTAKLASCITNTKVNSAFYPPGYVNCFAEVKVRCVYLCLVAGSTVWSYMTGDAP